MPSTRGGVSGLNFRPLRGGLVIFLNSSMGGGAVKFLKPTELDLHPPDVNYGTSLTIAVPG